MANSHKSSICIVVLVQFLILGIVRKGHSVEYTELSNTNTVANNYKEEEIKLHSRVQRDVKSSSGPRNTTINDYHKYYLSQFFSDASKLWIDIDNKKGATRHTHLSSQSLSKATITMSFDFPYYGHLIRNFTATSGGFLNLGMSTRRLITEIQYVAPLMAYFNPKLSEAASVSYYDDGTQLIVQWTNVHLHDNFKAGPFTFQCILKKNGTIMFVYKKIPISVRNISSAIHPVRVGVSDSFHIDYMRHYFGTLFHFRRHYVYDKVTLDVNQITNSSAYILYPKPSCITAKSCNECINRRLTTNFNCTWCSKIGRCSDGLDRKHYEWRINNCFQYSISTKEQCSVASRTTDSTGTVTARRTVTVSYSSSGGPSGGVIAAIVIVVLIVPLLILGVVVVYAYLHPTSPAGLYLIEHNPRKWFQTQRENRAVQYIDNSVPKKVLT